MLRQEKPFEHSVASWVDLLVILLLLILIFSYWTMLNKNFSFAANSFFQGILLISLTVFFLKIRGGTCWHLGLKVIPSWRGVVLGLTIGLGMAFLMAGLNRLIQLLPWQVPQQAAYDAINRAGSWREFLPVWAAVGLIAPLSEEIFFRGYSFPLFRTIWGSNKGAVLSALFFGAMHFDLWRLIPLAVAGWILNLLYEKTGSLWTAIIAHGVWNAALALLLSFRLFF